MSILKTEKNVISSNRDTHNDNFCKSTVTTPDKLVTKLVLDNQRMKNQVEFVELEKRKSYFEGHVYQKQRSDATKSE